jgi:hypothetical protein
VIGIILIITAFNIPVQITVHQDYPRQTMGFPLDVIRQLDNQKVK